MRMLDPDDIAEAVVFAVTLPRHVSISEIRINPSSYAQDCGQLTYICATAACARQS